jgi:2-methylcitrate dehydratase PrpD
VSFASFCSSTIVRTNVESSTEEVGMRAPVHATIASTAAKAKTEKWRQVMSSNAIGYAWYPSTAASAVRHSFGPLLPASEQLGDRDAPQASS